MLNTGKLVAIGELKGFHDKFDNVNSEDFSLKQFLKETGIKQFEIAKILNVHPSAVSSWKKGKYKMNKMYIQILKEYAKNESLKNE